MQATIVLEALKLPLSLGTYGPDDVVPEAHLLDAVLTIDPSLVLVTCDAMDQIYDYDPLIAKIEALARDGHYETQEWLLTRIAKVCAAEPVIQDVWLKLYKRPVRKAESAKASGADSSADSSEASGTLGLTLSLNREELNDIGAEQDG